MSTSQNPLTGGMRKSMGNFTTYRSGRKNIIRSKPFEPKDPKTEKQLLQRLKFKMLIDVYNSFDGITDTGFVENRKQLTGYNLFISTNYRLVYEKNSMNPVIDYQRLLISKGSIPRIRVLESNLTKEGVIVRFETGLELPKTSATDEMTALIKLKNGEVYVATQVRGVDETGTIVIEYSNLNPEEVECCYLFARSINGKLSSNSTYIELKLLT
jgi:hypothetical protein